MALTRRATALALAVIVASLAIAPAAYAGGTKPFKRGGGGDTTVCTGVCK